MGEALWLARRDIKQSWLSYPASAVFMAFFGFLGASLVAGIFEVEGFGSDRATVESTFNAFFADYFFVLMGCVFVVNAISMEYMRIWSSDVFSEKTTFLRSLPVATESVVFARVFSMLAAVPLNVLAFFLPTYLLTGLGELGFSYLWFVGIWLGWGLLYAGVTLLCELGLKGRTYCWFSFLLVVFIVLVVALLNIATGSGLVAGSASLAGTSFGVVAALVSVVVGAVGFYFTAKLTVRVVERREVAG